MPKMGHPRSPLDLFAPYQCLHDRVCSTPQGSCTSSPRMPRQYEMKTDLAHELWAILDALNSQSGTNPVGQTIAAFLKVDPDTNKVFSFITFVCNQIDLLHEQIKNSTYIND